MIKYLLLAALVAAPVAAEELPVDVRERMEQERETSGDRVEAFMQRVRDASAQENPSFADRVMLHKLAQFIRNLEVAEENLPLEARIAQ